MAHKGPGGVASEAAQPLPQQGIRPTRLPCRTLDPQRGDMQTEQISWGLIQACIRALVNLSGVPPPQTSGADLASIPSQVESVHSIVM